jgi:hypothetical protein
MTIINKLQTCVDTYDGAIAEAGNDHECHGLSCISQSSMLATQVMRGTW